MTVVRVPISVVNWVGVCVGIDDGGGGGDGGGGYGGGGGGGDTMIHLVHTHYLITALSVNFKSAYLIMLT